ncbi:MAG: 50S ribosomal protein L15 [Anaerolineae bacterium]|nr:50S ribosomal protein L15 [Anaerolineae bacterium]
MKLHDLRPAPGSTKKRIRKGRGIAAGKGKTAGRGTKGQKSRSGGGKGPYFEGGQLPLVRRLPYKRGFRNRNRVAYTPVNLASIADWEGEVTPELLAASGLIKKETLPVVILGEGELDRALTVKAHRFSASARAKIETAGGSVEVLPLA